MLLQFCRLHLLDTIVSQFLQKIKCSNAKISGKVKFVSVYRQKIIFRVERAWNTAFHAERMTACGKKTFSEPRLVAYCTPPPSEGGKN